MKVVWSDDAVMALVALETKLAQRYTAEKAAQVIDELVRRVDRLQDHPQLRTTEDPSRHHAHGTGP